MWGVGGLKIADKNFLFKNTMQLDNLYGDCIIELSQIMVKSFTFLTHIANIPFVPLLPTAWSESPQQIDF